MVELWVGETEAFRSAYRLRHPWPDAFDELRPAYWTYTWMEWIYCLHTLLHDGERAAELERRLSELARILRHWR